MVAQECGNEWCELILLNHESHVATGANVKSGVGQEVTHDLGVHRGSDRVVIASHDQGRLTDPGKPGKAQAGNAGQSCSHRALASG
jgi:hypothetical protein